MVRSLQKFRNYEIAELEEGGALELARSGEEIVCLAGLPQERRFCELHVVADVDANAPEAAPQVTAFQAAVKALAELTDRHVARVVEAGVDEGALYFVTEFIDGEELGPYLARCQPLPAWLALEIARQLVAGLLAVRPWPALLEKAAVWRARLSQEGETTDELRIRLVDFSLGRQTGGYVAASEVEGKAAREVGRVLCYALGGSLAEPVDAKQVSRLPVPPSLGRVVAALLDPKARLGAGALEKLRAQLEGCAREPALARRPDRLPHGFRPRLPLAAQFPDAETIAAELGGRYQVERGIFDAAQPYAQRAVRDGQAVTVQWLPPERLLSPLYGPALHLARERAPEGEGSPLLRVLEIGPGETPKWFVEEAPPRLSLNDVRRLRGTLTPGEAMVLLQALDSTVLFAEERGLPPVVLDPQQVFVIFDEATPGDDELAAQPVEHWPSFSCLLRAHPIPVQLFQPGRFSRERLTGTRGPRALAAPTAGGPLAADYAALFQWLCGGAAAVPDNVAEMVARTLNGSGEPDRRKFLAKLRPLAPLPPSAATAEKAAGPTPEAVAATITTAVDATPADALQILPPAPVERDIPRQVEPLDREAEHFPIPAQVDPRRPGGDVPLVSDDAPEEETGGFAEILMGAPTQTSTVRPAPSRSPIVETGDEDGMAAPVGALFGRPTDQVGEWDDDDLEEDEPPLDFHPRHERRGLSPVWLALLVVLAALLIAVIMAELTGLAPWRRLPPP